MNNPRKLLECVRRMAGIKESSSDEVSLIRDEANELVSNIDEQALKPASMVYEALALAPDMMIKAGMWNRDEADMYRWDCSPDITVRYHTYGSTAGPFGGIGGQALTSFPQVTVIYDLNFAMVYIGRGKGYCCYVTNSFLKALNDCVNLWTHSHEFRVQKTKR